MAFFDYLKPMGFGNPLTPGKKKNIVGNAWGKVGGAFTGTPERNEQRSLLRPEQEDLFQQLVNAGMNPGAGGAFGTSADYYRDLLSDDSQTMNQLSAPELRQFNEQTIPGIAEQFAGMGSGGLSSSGFRNATVNAGTDLAERLGAIRANLRSQGASGLAGIGQTGLGQYQENLYRPATPGLLESFAPAIGTGIGAAVGGPIGAGIGGSLGSGLGGFFGGTQNSGSIKGRTGPYGGSRPNFNQSMGMPNFNTFGMR